MTQLPPLTEQLKSDLNVQVEKMFDHSTVLRDKLQTMRGTDFTESGMSDEIAYKMLEAVKNTNQRLGELQILLIMLEVYGQN